MLFAPEAVADVVLMPTVEQLRTQGFSAAQTVPRIQGRAGVPPRTFGRDGERIAERFRRFVFPGSISHEIRARRCRPGYVASVIHLIIIWLISSINSSASPE